MSKNFLDFVRKNVDMYSSHGPEFLEILYLNFANAEDLLYFPISFLEFQFV